MYSNKDLFASLNRSQIPGKACSYGLSRGFIFVSGVQMELKIIFFTSRISWIDKVFRNIIAFPEENIGIFFIEQFVLMK